MAQPALQIPLNALLPQAQQTTAHPCPQQKPSATDMQLLGGYAPIKKLPPARALKVKKCKTFEKIIAAFMRFEQEKPSTERYEFALSLLKRVRCAQGDITKFLVFMRGFEDVEGSGYFISALMNTSREKDIFLDLTPFNRQPTEKDLQMAQYFSHDPMAFAKHSECTNNLCYKNTKNVKIKGDVGTGFGQGMIGGNVSIEGKGRNFFGTEMEGGSITVNGIVPTPPIVNFLPYRVVGMHFKMPTRLFEMPDINDPYLRGTKGGEITILEEHLLITRHGPSHLRYWFRKLKERYFAPKESP